MTYLEEVLKISELENYSFNKEIKFTFHDSIIFDEIPLISRLDHHSNLLKIYSPSQLNSYFLNTAIFYVNHLKIRAFHNLTLDEFEKYLICITYPDFDDKSLSEAYIPNICITHRKFLTHKLLPLEYEQAPWLSETLKMINLESRVITKYSISKDEYGIYTRLYVLL